jgi:SAM-dependent methyltransferase
VLGEELWERHATWWQEGYSEGADAEYEEQILPLAETLLAGARRVLDLGCGEGQLTRRLGRQGAQVVGLDPTANQIEEARRRGGSFVRGRGEQLPCATASFDAVVVCVALEHIDPFEPAVEEIARVLSSGGRFVAFLAHPLLQAPGSGWVDDDVLGEAYWRIGGYLDDHVALDSPGPGVELSFAHRPLSRYVHAMGQAGLVIEDMREPAPVAAVVEATGGFANGATIPRFLVLVARRIP